MGRSPTRAVPLIFNFTRTVIFFFFFEKDPYSNFNVHATLIKIQVYSFSKKKKIKFIARFSVCPHGTFPFTNPCQLKYYVIFYDSKKKKKNVIHMILYYICHWIWVFDPSCPKPKNYSFKSIWPHFSKKNVFNNRVAQILHSVMGLL